MVDEADLVVSKTAEPAEVTPGGTITYTVTVSNPNGPAEAVGVQITDAIPVGADFVPGSLDDDPACTFNAGLNQVECSAGTVLPTASFHFDFDVQVSTMPRCPPRSPTS